MTDRAAAMHEAAACACLTVTYAPIDNGDGSLSARWRCGSCGMEFRKAPLPPLPEREELARELWLAANPGVSPTVWPTGADRPTWLAVADRVRNL